jgi:pimeloyl-ACP methyl ester carboxylesterase
MAEDLFILVRELGIKSKIHIVGHDIGGMIGFAYASRYPDHVASLIWGECPLPGSTFYEQVKSNPDAFHFVFHRILDLPEALIAGRSRSTFNTFTTNNPTIAPPSLSQMWRSTRMRTLNLVRCVQG